MKKWMQPELSKLGVESTESNVCYCKKNGTMALDENGTIYGHSHKPPVNGGDCSSSMPKPKPGNPAEPGFGPAGGVTPALS